MNFATNLWGTSTSAVGAMSSPATLGAALVGGAMLLMDATSSRAFPSAESQALRPLDQTNSGIPVPDSRMTASAILELRRLSGLTWEQLARLFNVDRRSLHFWANGKPLSPVNEERLQRLLATIRKLDRGRAGENRALLLQARSDGAIPIDLLASGKYEQALAIVGIGIGRAQVKPTPLSPEAKASRKPRPPAELVGARQDPVHADTRRLLAAKPIRTKREQ